MKCKSCEHCSCKPPHIYSGGLKSRFYCNHPEQQHIHDYEKEHKILKEHSFISFGIGQSPDIKTSPRWCPLKKK